MDVMDEICSLCFIPLADYVWRENRHKLPLLEEEAAKAGAIIMCWRKFGNYRPDKGSSMAFFWQIIWHHYLAESQRVAADPHVLECDLLEDDQ